jgi:hypothetical protein
MKKVLQIVLALAILAFAGATAFYYSEYQKAQVAFEHVKAAESASRGQYGEALNAIAEIQDSLNALTPGQADLAKESASLRAEQPLGGANREVLDRIALLRAGLERNRARIQRLEGELHHNGLRMAGLQKLVASLKATAAEKEQQIADLSGQVTGLKAQVGGLTTQVAEVQDTMRVHDETLAARQRELATVYYVAGNKRELARSGVIVATGGLLGIGRTLLPSNTVSGSVFKPLNTDEETILSIPSPKARVLSAQPASSYELRLVNGHTELHIIAPDQFRKVRQLVIVTA